MTPDLEKQGEQRPRAHEHEFSSLWYHLGPYGDQTVHIHPCFDGCCSTVLVGRTRTCDGKGQSHRREKLPLSDAAREWAHDPVPSNQGEGE